jgi:hypothetical protein
MINRRKILSFLMIIGFFAAVKIFTINAQTPAKETVKTWRIFSSQGSITATLRSYLLDSGGNFKETVNTKAVANKKNDETDLREISRLLHELNLPGAKTKIVKGSKIWDSYTSSVFITLDAKDFMIIGRPSADERQIMLSAKQKRIFLKLKKHLEKIGFKIDQ